MRYDRCFISQFSFTSNNLSFYFSLDDHIPGKVPLCHKKQTEQRKRELLIGIFYSTVGLLDLLKVSCREQRGGTYSFSFTRSGGSVAGQSGGMGATEQDKRPELTKKVFAPVTERLQPLNSG